jgi:hypothetical protein
MHWRRPGRRHRPVPSRVARPRLESVTTAGADARIHPCWCRVWAAYLLSVWVGIEPVRGISLAELVDAALARVSDAPALLKQIALLGYSPLDRDQYATRFTPLETPFWFRAEDVPRVRAIDPGISQVRYVVALDIDRSLAGEIASGLWRHFCQVEPSMVADPIQLP